MGASPARSLLSRLCVLAIHATAVADATSDCFAIPDLLALYDSTSMYGCYFCRVDLGRAGLMRKLRGGQVDEDRVARAADLEARLGGEHVRHRLLHWPSVSGHYLMTD